MFFDTAIQSLIRKNPSIRQENIFLGFLAFLFLLPLNKHYRLPLPSSFSLSTAASIPFSPIVHRFFPTGFLFYLLNPISPAPSVYF